MKLRERYRRLNLWNKLGFWGAVASIVGVAIALLVILWPSGKPQLTLYVALVATVGEISEETPRRYGGFLVDLCTGEVAPGSGLAATLDSAGKDVLRPDLLRRMYIGKLIFRNSGNAAATDVRFVFGTEVEIEPKIETSVNVEASLRPLGEQVVAGRWPYRYQISIAHIPERRSAFVTLYWIVDATPTTYWGDVLGREEFFVPRFVAFLSRGTSGEYGGILPFPNASAMEMAAIGEVHMPLMTFPLSIPPGATITIEQLPSVAPTVEVLAGLCE